MAADFEARLERLENAQGVGDTIHVVVFPGDDEQAKIAKAKAQAGGRPLVIHRIRFPEWPPKRRDK